MVALASFRPVPNILFLGKPTKKPLCHTTQPETTNLDHWSPVQSRVRPGCARNHLDSTEDSLLAADEQRIHTWLPKHSCGFQHCQPQDTIVPHKGVTEVQKTVVAWFKFPVEEEIKELWWEISAPPTNPLFMEDLPLILASIWSDESIWSQQLHPQPHLFVCWVLGWLFFYFFFNTHCITITTVVQTESGHVWTQPLLSTLTSPQQCSSPLPISHCHSCSILITLNTYSFVVTSDALRSQAQYFSMRATALSFRHKSFACNWDEVSFWKKTGISWGTVQDQGMKSLRTEEPPQISSGFDSSAKLLLLTTCSTQSPTQTKQCTVHTVLSGGGGNEWYTADGNRHPGLHESHTWGRTD